MGLRQQFRFAADSDESIERFLQSLSKTAVLEERNGSFLYMNKSEQPHYTFHCVIVPNGIDSDRAGEYLSFLGLFIEELTGEFGAVTIEDV
jgi:hypothetical protein